MPQETNLNITPYNDDFNTVDNYYRVLFKPSNPVQGRELNNLQSILQNQVEQFGNHIFKEGSVVIPGNIDYDNDLQAIELQNSYNGTSVSTYIPLLVGKTIRGKRSNIRATVILFQTQKESERGNASLYIKYISSDTSTGLEELFSDGEELILEASSTETLSTGEIVVFTAGETIAVTIPSNCNSVASSVTISDGVYFIRGTFVNVYKQTLLLDQYSNISSYKVGFFVSETIVTSDDKIELVDNASGFPNYTAPGADRFSIQLILTKYAAEEEKPSNFVQLLEIRKGVLISNQDVVNYNILEQEFAKRTFDESGNYYVNSPVVSISESLNNLIGNNGVYGAGEVTYDGNTPSDSLGIYQVSPLKAYVQGYEAKTASPRFIDFKKPRTTKLLEGQEIIYYTGSTLTLNRVYGTPVIGIGTNYTLSLRDSRVGNSQLSAPGKEIGLARVYDFALESGSYTTNNPNLNEWDISLFDVQSYTELTLNQSLDSDIQYNVPCQIVGKSSGASGFIRYDSRNSGIVTAYDIRGTFATGEKLIFNGIENTRVTTAVTAYSLNDVKAVYGIVGTAYTFTADVKQYPSTQIGQVNITAFDQSTGISTVTRTNNSFIGSVKVGNLVAFTTPGISTSNYARVETVGSKTLTLAGVTTVSGICEGKLPSIVINPSDFTLLSSQLTKSQDNTLYTELPKENVNNVNLLGSNLIIRKQFDVIISSNAVGPILSDTNETFLPFDEERYVLIREDGITETLTSDKFTYGSGSSTITISGLGSNSKAKLIVTLRKINVKEKVKYKNRVKTITIDKSKYIASGIGNTTLNDGLIYGNYPYGSRVQDIDICLLEPDVTKIYGVFESSTVTPPSLPRLTLSSISGPTNKTGDLLVGETIIGSNSKAVAIYVKSVNDLSINFVYLNSSTFTVNETLTFKDTGVTANVVSLDFGDSNITSNFTFEPGQKSSIYDYSKLVRKTNAKEPTRELSVVFESADYLTSDDGDIVTVNSYSNFDYCDLPKVDGISVSDIIDARPRVSRNVVNVNSRSPFEFLGRDFSNNSANIKNILASDESIILDYSFYLPRIDKIFLSKTGQLQLSSGAPAELPQPPNQIEDSLEIATIYLPAYLCAPEDADIQLATNKRYRMNDIKNLEDRILNLEYYTSLTLLENHTSNLFIPDSSGLNRFKSGFFVDNFSNTISQLKTTEVKNSVDLDTGELRPSHYTTALDLVISTNSIAGIGTVADSRIDLRYIADLIGSNVKKTGQLLTLDYDEVVAFSQPYSTRVDNVASYRNNTFSGTIIVYPSSDVWADQVTVSTKTVSAANYSPTISQLAAVSFDQQLGFNPVLWNSVSSIWEKGNTLIKSEIIPYLRSRNIEFTAKRMKPLSRLYSYFDGRAMDKFIVPKLIQIQMTSGTFQIGETVIGSNITTGAEIKFRVAKSNHKYGQYDSPSVTYSTNPYYPDTIISENYSSTSTIINVDTYSLANMVQGGFSGYIESGMTIKGQTTGAEATISSDIKLIADNSGDIIGSLFIPNRNIQQNPSFESGIRVFRLTNSPTNSLVEGAATSFAEEKYYSSGRLNSIEENIVRVEPPQTPPPPPEPTPVQSTPAPEVSTQVQSTPAPEVAIPDVIAPAPEPMQTQVSRPWQDGDIVVNGRSVTTSDEGQSLVNSINSKNGTSFTVGVLMDAIGLRRINTVSELQRINAIAKKLYEGNPTYWSS
jgi:hypothetical protein